MSSDNSLITFKAISNFANDLGDVFGDTHRPLKLYTHLINKTTISHDKPIQKHIDAFRSFCITNRDAIANKNVKNLSKDKISYSKRVFINMNEIFQQSDSDTANVIWNHLLTISALVDPAGQARKILKEQSESGGDEANFLADIISKVEDKVNPNSNPMEAISAIMQSGIFTDLVNGMGNGLQDGSLNLGKLMGTVQKMVTKLSNDAGDQEGGEQAVNIINTMMNSLNVGSNAPNNGQKMSELPNLPDLAGMLGPMMGALMGGNTNTTPNLTEIMNNISSSNGNTIEEHINRQMKSEKYSQLPTIKEND